MSIRKIHNLSDKENNKTSFYINQNTYFSTLHIQKYMIKQNTPKQTNKQKILYKKK